MLLVFMRHGPALARDAGQAGPDAGRPLTAKGLRAVLKSALGLERIEIRPDIVLTSPLVRAAQTAEVAARALRCKRGGVRLVKGLMPGAEPREVLAECARSAAETVLLVGHSPQIESVIATAIGGEPRRMVRLEKAGAAAVEVDRERGGRGRLVWMMPPRALRMLA